VTEPSRFLTFDRMQWAALRAATPLTLDHGDVEALRGINERLSLDEVAEVYLPLSRLLNLYIVATQGLTRVADVFLGAPPGRVPYVIGIAGSVAAGKSTTARVLQALLRRWPDHPSVDLITTDGFLWPNAVLEARDEASRIWRTINGVNLAQNIRPTRERAHLILEKSGDHGVRGVRLRKL